MNTCDNHAYVGKGRCPGCSTTISSDGIIFTKVPPMETTDSLVLAELKKLNSTMEIIQRIVASK